MKDERESRAQRRTGDDATGALVRQKASRIRRERGRKRPLLAQLVHVGVLGWIFVLPIIGLAWLGHLVGQVRGEVWPALAGVALGVAIGAYGVWRQVTQSLDAERRADEDAGEGRPRA